MIDKKEKILIIGPSSSGKSTLIQEWITKGLAKKKEICFAYQYNIIRRYTRRIFHYNLFGNINNNTSDIEGDKLLKKILTINSLSVYILFADQKELEDRISKREYTEYDIINQKKEYKREKILKILRKCNYIELYKSLIQLLDKQEIKYTILDTTEFKLKEITHDKIY